MTPFARSRTRRRAHAVLEVLPPRPARIGAPPPLHTPARRKRIPDPARQLGHDGLHLPDLVHPERGEGLVDERRWVRPPPPVAGPSLELVLDAPADQAAEGFGTQP